MAVVDGPRWEGMKKFNMNELYKIAGAKEGPQAAEDESKNKESEPKGGEKTGTAADAEADVAADGPAAE